MKFARLNRVYLYSIVPAMVDSADDQIYIYVVIEEHHSCFRLGGYFMAAMLAADSYSRIGFSLYFAVRARSVRIPGGSKFYLEPEKIHPCWNLTGT